MDQKTPSLVFHIKFGETVEGAYVPSVAIGYWCFSPTELTIGGVGGEVSRPHCLGPHPFPAALDRGWWFLELLLAVASVIRTIPSLFNWPPSQPSQATSNNCFWRRKASNCFSDRPLES
jgi:hypothetical protein